MTLTELETDLSARLGAAASAFLSDLEASGRLVRAGGAGTLQRLQDRTESRGPAWQSATDVIVDACGYPAEVAARIASALASHGLLRGDEQQPTPHEPPVLALNVRGAVVLPSRLAADSVPAEPEPLDATQLMQRVEEAPQVRPSAASAEEVLAERADRDAAMARAVTVCAQLQTEHVGRPEVMGIEATADGVTVAIKAQSLEDWEYWLAAIRAPRDVATQPVGYAQVAVSLVDDVRVQLVAHEVPRLLHEAFQQAAEPFFLWGRIYDLSRGHVDATGQTWIHLGHRQDSGMPLMTLRGSSAPPCPLASIVMTYGPLYALLAPAAVASGTGEGSRR
ncbi:BN159_2729 family protein [Streptomyces sp. NPDC003656]